MDQSWLEKQFRVGDDQFLGKIISQSLPEPGEPPSNAEYEGLGEEAAVDATGEGDGSTNDEELRYVPPGWLIGRTRGFCFGHGASYLQRAQVVSGNFCVDLSY